MKGKLHAILCLTINIFYFSLPPKKEKVDCCDGDYDDLKVNVEQLESQPLVVMNQFFVSIKCNI